MQRRAESIAHELQASVQVCWSVLEMESWLIGGIERRSSYCGLRSVGRVPTNTEALPPDPKRWLQTHLNSREYGPKTQECLARNIDLQTAKEHNRSMQVFFDKLAGFRRD